MRSILINIIRMIIESLAGWLVTEATLPVDKLYTFPRSLEPSAGNHHMMIAFPNYKS